MYSWGITGNRSGDGETTVREPVMFSGGQLTEETGQLVVLNKEGFREGALLGLNFLKEIYTDPKYAKMLPPGVNAWTDPSNNEAFLAGKIAFTSNAGTMFAKAVFDKNPVADDTLYIPGPKGLGPNARVPPGRRRDALLRHEGHQEQGGRRAADPPPARAGHPARDLEDQHRLRLPDLRLGLGRQVLQGGQVRLQDGRPWKTTAFDQSGYIGGAWPGPPNPWVASLESSNFWTDMFGEVLGGKSPEDALKSAHDKAVRVAKEFGFKGE